MSRLKIRKEEPNDFYEVEYLAKKAFWNLHRPGCDEHYLVHLLRQSDDYIPQLSRVAEIDGEIVGTIMYSKAAVISEGNCVDILTFGPLCVDPSYQNNGVGATLLEVTMKLAKDEGYKAIVIFGEPGYYPKHGFKTCDHFGITTHEGKNFDAFMGIELVEGALKAVEGKFYESKVFEQLLPEKVEAFDQQFPYMEKLKLPGQWE